LLKFTLIVSILIILTGCNDSTPDKKYDAQKLIKERCSSCHNLDMPPTISDDELAPPMMAVAFHVSSFVKPSDESQRTLKAIEFVRDYVYAPALEKSFCDKESLKRYGLMPSQKKNVTEGELKSISTYMFEHYTQKNLTQAQKEKNEYDALEEGHKIALKYRCLGCHGFTRKIVGPSLKNIADKVTMQEMQNSIKNGSKGRWESSHGAIMPAFKIIEERELVALSQWLLKQR